MTFPVIKSFDYEVPNFISVLHDMNIGIFDNLGITSWKGMDKRWIYFGQVLRVPILTKFRN